LTSTTFMQASAVVRGVNPHFSPDTEARGIGIVGSDAVQGATYGAVAGGW